MRKLILTPILFLLISLSNSTYGQTATDTTTTSRFVYCELVGMAKLFSLKVAVSVDYGEERSFFQDTRMRDDQTGKVTSFNSMVDALNYMGTKGWVFEQAYIVTTGNQNVYHWLLKKKIE